MKYKQIVSNYLSTYYYLLLLFLLPMAVCVSGCNSSGVDSSLTAIEQTLDNATDSAEILPAIRELDSIAQLSLSGSRRDLVSLLTVQSRHKQHIPVAEDSLIFILGKRYGNPSADMRHQMKWHFYRGIARMQLTDYRGAIYDALHAVNLSSRIPDTLFMAKSHELLADVYRKILYVSPAIEHRRKSINFYNAIGRDINAAWGAISLIDELRWNGQHVMALQTIDSLKNANITDSSFLAKLHESAIDVYVDLHKDEDALKSFGLMRSFCGDMFTYQMDYAFVINMFTATNQIDSAKYYSEFAVKYDSAYYCGSLGQQLNIWAIATKEKDYSRATDAAREVIELTNATTRNTLSFQSSLASNDYYLEIAEEEKSRSNRKSTIILIIAVTSAIALSSIALYIRYNNKANQRMINAKQLENEQLRHEMSLLIDNISLMETRQEETSTRISQESDSLRKEMLMLLNSGINTFDAVANDYFINQNANMPNHEPSLKQLEAEIAFFKSDRFLNGIINIANGLNNNIIDEFQLKNPKIKPIDCRILALKLVGFSTRSISLILDISIEKFYSRWRRIRAKIDLSDSFNRSKPECPSQ